MSSINSLRFETINTNEVINNSNILGFIMMHKGVVIMVANEERKYNKKDLYKDLAFSVIYSVIIVILVTSGVLKFPTEYFQ